MASVAEFQTLYPEFAATSPERLELLLPKIIARVDPEFGDDFDEVVYLELADTLAAGAAGRNTRKQKGTDGQNSYSVKLAELKGIHAIGRR